MRRVPTVLVGVSLVVAACGGGGSVLGVSDGDTATTSTAATAATTEIQPTLPTTVTTSTTTTTEALAWRPIVSVHQILIRYDGITGAGTFEATVCNQQETGDIQPEVVISANGVDVVVGGIVIPPMSCRGFFEPSVDLPGFGVTGPGLVNVAVAATPETGPGEGVEVVDPVDVPGVTMAAPPAQLEVYRDCLASGHNHRNCVGNVRYHPIGDAGEVMKVSGRYMAIGPAAYGEVLSYFLADNELCTPRIEAWMGTAGPTPIAHRLVVADDYGGAYSAPFVDIHSIGSESDWDAANVNVASWWRGNLEGLCDNAHELTHLILGDTPMPGWLNEGLATYMEADPRSGSGRDPSVECRETGWYGSLFEGGQAEVPYQNLMDYDTDVPGIYYYYTAMCFWDHIESGYGHSKLQEIIAATASHRDPGFNGCSGLVGTVLFIRDIVNPILGVDISPLTQEKWGFGETFTSCEGL